MNVFFTFINKNSKRLFISVFLFFITSIHIYAETFRASRIVQIPISADGSPFSAKVGVNDCIIIDLPGDMTFIEGLELSFKFPTEIATKKNAVNWAFYDEIDPVPSAAVLDYDGTKSICGEFGNTYSINMKIPLNENSNLKKDVYSHLIESVPQIIDGKIFMRLNLDSKYAQSDFASTKIRITAKAIFADLGELSIDAEYPNAEKNPYTILVDGIPSNNDNGLFLPPGIHTITLISDYYRTEQRTVTIEQGKHQSLKVYLKSIVPIVKVSAPEGTKIFIDGTLMQSSSSIFELSQGEHIIRLVFGNYETVKSISVLNGRTYTISVIFDASISEE